MSEEQNEQELTSEEMNLEPAKEDTSNWDKERQKIQQEIGNKVRPIQDEIKEIKEMLLEKQKPQGGDLDDDDYVTVAKINEILDSRRDTGIDERLASIEQTVQAVSHKESFHSRHPGISYDEVMDQAFKLANEVAPGYDERDKAVMAHGFMEKIAQGKKPKPVQVEPKDKAVKKAPDSAKGAQITDNPASVSANTDFDPDSSDLSDEEILQKYFGG